jgi:ribonuclease P protein component
VLSRSSRLTSPADFQTALRRGRRVGSRSLVVHLWVPHTPSDLQLSDSGPAVAPARVGFVVSKAVGGATRRNLVKRRLRHLCRELLEELPTGSLLVVRALPPAAEASYDELGADLRHGVDRLLQREAGVSR